MFRVIGIVALSFIASTIVYMPQYKLKQSIDFMKETCKITEYLISNVNMHNTYPKVFEELNLKYYKFYNLFNFNNQTDFWRYITEKKIIKNEYQYEISSFFLNIGKKPSVKEKYFTEKYLTIFDTYYKELSNQYKNNIQISTILSVSTFLLIFIVLI